MSADPSRLSVNVTHADGSTTRWGADEIDPQDQPLALSFGTVVPGGFGSHAVTLPRGLVPGLDENLLDSISFTGPGGEVAYEGRVHRLPRQQGDARYVTVQGVGWSSHLSDDRGSFRELFIDRSMAGWTEMSGPRQAATSSYDIINTQSSTTGAVLSMLAGGAGASAMNTPLVERWYDAGPGLKVARILVDQVARVGLGGGDANLTMLAFVADDDVATGYIASSDQKAATSIDWTPASAHRWAFLQWQYAGTGGTPPASYGFTFQDIAVIGNHGLTLRGTGPTAGFYKADMIRNVLARAAPKLTVGSISDSGFIIPQQAFLDATTAADAVLSINRFDGDYWGVWEDRTFVMWVPDAASLTWEARLEDGATVSSDGTDVVQLASAVYVYYTDPYGRSRVYGPAGAANCDFTSAYLNGDGTDAYSAHGIAAPAALKLQDVATDDMALNLGRVWLAENNAPSHSGNITIKGLVRHPTEGMVPAWRVRAGDHIIVSDSPDSAPLPIIATSYDHPTRTNSLQMVSAPLMRMDGLLQRIGVEVGLLGG